MNEVYVCLSECDYVSVCVCACVRAWKRETERQAPLELELRIQSRPKQLPLLPFLPSLYASSLLQHYSVIPVIQYYMKRRLSRTRTSLDRCRRSQLSSNMVQIEGFKVISWEIMYAVSTCSAGNDMLSLVATSSSRGQRALKAPCKPPLNRLKGHKREILIQYTYCNVVWCKMQEVR